MGGVWNKERVLQLTHNVHFVNLFSGFKGRGHQSGNNHITTLQQIKIWVLYGGVVARYAC